MRRPRRSRRDEAAERPEQGAPEQSRPKTSAHQEKRIVVPGIRADQRSAGAPYAMPRIGGRGIAPELGEAMRQRLGRGT